MGEVRTLAPQEAGPAPVSGPAEAPPPGRATSLRVAYLVNQYPKVSHSFVRREIAALEAMGCAVERIAVRRCGDELVDEADRAELARTRALLEHGVIGLLASMIACALATPVRFVGALRMAWRVGRRSDRGRLRHLAYFAEACTCVRWLRLARVRHLHAHFGTNSATVAMLCRELGGPPYSFTVHGPEEFDKPEFIALGEKVERSAFAVAISEFGRSQIYRRLPHHHWDKVAVVRCGVDAVFSEAEPLPVPAARRLVCVGRLCEQKGQALLIEATKRLVDAGHELELVLIGGGPMQAELEGIVDRLGLRGVVQFAGWMSGAQVRGEIARARALVLPSFAEGLPVVLMEALALGRPVISTAIAGIPELVRSAENGWLVTAGDLEALVAAMQESLEASPELLERYGAAGRARVLARHDAHTEAGKLLGLIAGSAGNSE